MTPMNRRLLLFLALGAALAMPREARAICIDPHSCICPNLAIDAVLQGPLVAVFADGSARLHVDAVVPAAGIQPLAALGDFIVVPNIPYQAAIGHRVLAVELAVEWDHAMNAMTPLDGSGMVTCHSDPNFRITFEQAADAVLSDDCAGKINQLGLDPPD